MDNNINKTEQPKVRTFTLCRVCNLSGRKGNALVKCASCNKRVHSRSCSSLDKITSQVQCNMCKLPINVRRSVSMATTPSQSAAVKSGRRSAPQAVTPTPTSSVPGGQKRGRGSLPTPKPATESSKPAIENSCEANSTGCAALSLYAELEKELHRLRVMVQDLQITCTNNSTIVNHLKQENQRLLSIIKDLQKMPSTIVSPTNENSVIPNNNIIPNFQLSCKCNINNSNFLYNYPDNEHFSSINNEFSSFNNINNSSQSSLNKNNCDIIRDTTGNCTVVKRVTTPSDGLPPTLGADASCVSGHERREVFITGFMQIYNVSSLRSISFAILKVLLPSLCPEDICDVRIVRPRTVRGTDWDSDSSGLTPSFIVRLRTTEQVRLIIRARSSFKHNYLTTRNLDLTLLSSEVASALPNCKIFVNEVLSSIDQLDYLSLKETAKKLGFKYVWHKAGRYLVRWREGERAHAIKTHADITTILNSITSREKPGEPEIVSTHPSLPPNSTSLPMNSESDRA